MKTVLLILLFALAFAVSVRLERPGGNVTPASEHLLSANEVNPPLKKIGDGGLVRSGTPIWFHADRTSAGTIVETEEEALLVQMNSGVSQWVLKKHLRNAWVPDDR